MRRVERTNPLVVVAAAAVGIALGLVVQFALSGRGHPPFVPPISLAASLLVIAGLLLAFGLRLRRHVKHRPGAINPFHAVRLLAAARAGQLVGALLGGFCGGLALSLLGRSVPAPVATWLPMLLALLGGAVLVACAAITEHLCRVPPGDGENDEARDPDVGPVSGGHPSDRPAYRG
ncbi:MAG: DUF3180 domain-containing protein [Leucobacter sp.]